MLFYFSTFSNFFENKIIEAQAIGFFRGRSIVNSFIIIDEAQNLTINQAKTLQQEVCDNQTLIEEIGKVDILTSLHKYTTQEVRNELDKAFSAVFENNDNPEIIKVYEEAKKCIALA